MNIKRLVMLVLVMFLMISVNSRAQVQAELTELNVSGAYSTISQDGQSIYSMNLILSAGYFIWQYLEVGGDAGVTKMKDEDTIGSVGPFVSFHYLFNEESKIVPFAGIQGGTTFGFDENILYYGGFLGAKAFIGSGGGGAVSLQLFYLRHEPSKKTKPFDQFGALTGISIFF